MALLASRRQPSPALTGLVGSAVRLPDKLRRSAVKAESWQAEAWGFYDLIGEFRYAMNWIAMSCSRAGMLVQGRDETGAWQDLDDVHPASKYLAELVDGCGGKSQFLHTAALHLGVPGETFILGLDERDDTNRIVGYRWRLVEATEVKNNGRFQTVRDPETGEDQEIGPDSLMIRIWRPHPKDGWQADSASRSLLLVLREIEHLSKHVGATIDSRLAGNGLLVLPREVSLSSSSGTATGGDPAGQPDIDPFMAQLVETMTTPLRDRDNPSAVVPLVIRVPGEFVDKVKHVTFGTSFDDRLLEMRDSAIRRLALGLDMPPEQLLGVAANSNAWSSWQVTEEGIKTSIQPVLELICESLTHQFLEPVLSQSGVDGEYRVWYDVDDLIQRPNNSEQARALWELGLLSDVAVRAANGFEESDAPEAEEFVRRLAVQLLQRGVVDDELAVLAGFAPGTLPELEDGTAPPPPPSVTPPAAENPDGTPDTQNRLPAPGQTPPAHTAAAVTESVLVRRGQRAALHPTAAALVVNALTLYGRKVRRSPGGATFRGTPDHRMHCKPVPVPESPMKGLFPGIVPVAKMLEVDAAQFEDVLTGFTEQLITDRVPFGAEQREKLRDVLEAELYG